MSAEKPAPLKSCPLARRYEGRAILRQGLFSNPGFGKGIELFRRGRFSGVSIPGSKELGDVARFDRFLFGAFDLVG
jgi:hypothetical protein